MTDDENPFGKWMEENDKPTFTPEQIDQFIAWAQVFSASAFDGLTKQWSETLWTEHLSLGQKTVQSTVAFYLTSLLYRHWRKIDGCDLDQEPRMTYGRLTNMIVIATSLGYIIERGINSGGTKAQTTEDQPE